MRKFVTPLVAAGIVAAGIATAGAAHADTGPLHQPVTAHIVVNQSLTVSGFSADISFPNAIIGQRSIAQGAEQFRVVTNLANGVSVSVQPENGGAHVAPGQPDVIPDQAFSITTSHGEIPINPNNPVLTDNVPNGDHSISHDWNLDVPTSIGGFSGALSAQFTYNVVANA